MRRPVALVVLAVAATLSALRAPAPAAAKDAKPPPVKTGIFQLEGTDPVRYILMSVPKDYDPARWYPLLFLLHPQTGEEASSKPEPFVGVWSEGLTKRGWIVASPMLAEYDNETSISPIQQALRKVVTTYHVDEKRVVLVGHNAGAMMAWRMATRSPTLWVSVMAFGAEIPQQDRGPALKPLAGKRAYLFRGEKDKYYTAPMLQMDRKHLEAAKVDVTVFEKKDWPDVFPTPDLETLCTWVDASYPAGAWRDRAEAAEKAIAAGELPAAAKALAELATELKKAPYAAFDAKAAALGKALLEAGRARLEEAQKTLDADPADALQKMEAAARSLKGVKGLEEEAAKALAAMRKLPAVVEALKKKEAETAGASYMEKAAALEAKGDLPKALELYRKAASLEWSRKDEAAKKVDELQAKAGG